MPQLGNLLPVYTGPDFVGKLRSKHNLPLTDLTPECLSAVESSDIAWLSSWEQAVVREEPLWCILEKLGAFVSFVRNKKRILVRIQFEYETLRVVVDKISKDPELKGHLQFVTSAIA